MEGGCCGCLFLLSDRPIFHEIAGSAAEFVDPENVIRIAEAMKQSINDQERRKDFGSKAQERSKIYSQTQFKETFMRAIS